jgi:hypothetical protein
MDEMCTTRPHRRCFMPGTSSRISTTGAVMFTCHMARPSLRVGPCCPLRSVDGAYCSRACDRAGATELNALRVGVTAAVLITTCLRYHTDTCLKRWDDWAWGYLRRWWCSSWRGQAGPRGWATRCPRCSPKYPHGRTSLTQTLPAPPPSSQRSHIHICSSEAGPPADVNRIQTALCVCALRSGESRNEVSSKHRHGGPALTCSVTARSTAMYSQRRGSPSTMYFCACCSSPAGVPGVGRQPHALG